MAGNESDKSVSFFEKVFAVVRLIPYGRVTSYGAIAGYLGTRGSARMVGWAMNAATPRAKAHNPVSLVAPPSQMSNVPESLFALKICPKLDAALFDAAGLASGSQQK